jgi:hypothetical protein
MKRILSLLLLGLIQTTAGFSQPDSLQQQINKQVWKPFIKAFNDLDTEGFMGVHSREMSRVIQDGNLIYGYDKYSMEMKQGNENATKTKQTRMLELRFTQRIAANDRAFEVGYYKFTSIAPNGSIRKGYGKFHVLLRRQNGTWKILMDADSSEKTDEDVFMSAKPIE